MLRRALLPGSSSLVARKAATMVNSVTATRMAAVASPVRPVSSIFRRLYSSEQNSDPRKHPRDLDDDFEEVDPRKAATNQQGEAAEEPEVLIMDIAAENLQQVIAASPFPLIVFLYAPKDSICQKLDQKLQKLTLDCKGGVRMVRVDVSMSPETVAELGIQTLPTTVAIYRNQVITSFPGMPNDKALEQLFEETMRIAGASSVAILVDKANIALEEDNIREASEIFIGILNDPTLKAEAIALAGLARCALKEGKVADAQEIIQAIQERYPKDLYHPEVSKAVASVELASNAGSPNELAALEESIKADPQNPELRYKYAVKLTAMGKHKEAIDQCLESIKKDRNWNDQAARKHLLKIFESLGNDNDLVSQARRRLSSIWF